MDDIIWWKDWRLYADALWELKDYDKAIEIYYDVINKINKQKVYYSDSDFRYNTSDIYARLYYLFKEQNNFKEAYEVIKKGYEINPERRQLDVIESAIFNEDYEYAIELSKKEYLKDKNLNILLDH